MSPKSSIRFWTVIFPRISLKFNEKQSRENVCQYSGNIFLNFTYASSLRSVSTARCAMYVIACLFQSYGRSSILNSASGVKLYFLKAIAFAFYIYDKSLYLYSLHGTSGLSASLGSANYYIRGISFYCNVA